MAKSKEMMPKKFKDGSAIRANLKILIFQHIVAHCARKNDLL